MVFQIKLHFTSDALHVFVNVKNKINNHTFIVVVVSTFFIALHFVFIFIVSRKNKKKKKQINI